MTNNELQELLQRASYVELATIARKTLPHLFLVLEKRGIGFDSRLLVDSDGKPTDFAEGLAMIRGLGEKHGGTSGA